MIDDYIHSSEEEEIVKCTAMKNDILLYLDNICQNMKSEYQIILDDAEKETMMLIEEFKRESEKRIKEYPTDHTFKLLSNLEVIPDDFDNKYISKANNKLEEHLINTAYKRSIYYYYIQCYPAFAVTRAKEPDIASRQDIIYSNHDEFKSDLEKQTKYVRFNILEFKVFNELLELKDTLSPSCQCVE